MLYFLPWMYKVYNWCDVFSPLFSLAIRLAINIKNSNWNRIYAFLLLFLIWSQLVGFFFPIIIVNYSRKGCENKRKEKKNMKSSSTSSCTYWNKLKENLIAFCVNVNSEFLTDLAILKFNIYTSTLCSVYIKSYICRHYSA